METPGAYKNLAHYIVGSLVDNPDQVTVTEIDSGNMVVVEVQVDATDMGRVIGKGGNVVNSIRTLLQVLAVKHGKRVSLEIVED